VSKEVVLGHIFDGGIENYLSFTPILGVASLYGEIVG